MSAIQFFKNLIEKRRNCLLISPFPTGFLLSVIFIDFEIAFWERVKRMENIVGNRENGGTWYFLLFLQVFESSIWGLGLCGKGLIYINDEISEDFWDWLMVICFKWKSNTAEKH